MKTFLLSLLFVSFAAVVAVANDGVFYASGGTLVPLQETQVELRRELLKFYVVDHHFARVEIDFEFFNPGKAKTVTVGFVTPPADGDVDEEQAKHPFITNFTVVVNGRSIPFKVKKMADTSFRMGDAEVEGRDFVYYFPVTFKTGINRIRHTYQYRGGASVELDRIFDYQITTGKRWANRRIDDFELQIHPDNGIFAIVASFEKGVQMADWKIVGDGVFEDRTREWFGSETTRVRLFHLNSGYISFSAKNFKPANDLFFGEFNWAAGWTKALCDPSGGCYEEDALEKASRYFSLGPNDYDETALNELTDEEIRYVRNYFYAVRGLPFRSLEMRRFFGQFFWYRPIEDLTAADIVFSKAEDDFLRTLAAITAKRDKAVP